MSTVVLTPQDLEQSLPPASLIGDAHTQLTRIFNSPIPQCPTDPKCDTPTNQSSLILYCPIEGGESIIDATVQELARRAGAVVTTIDIVQQINEREGSFWKAYGDDETSMCSESKDNGAGYFRMDELISTTKLIKSIEAALLRPDVPEPKFEPASHRNIVYLRDFGFLATFSPACYGKILSVIQKSLPGIDDNTGVLTSTALILGASPLLVRGGLFQKGATKGPAGGDTSFDLFRSLYTSTKSGSKDEPPGSWGEDNDAEKLREQRLSQQHEMWKSDSLIDHIYEQLARTSVLDECITGQCSRSPEDSPQTSDTPPPQQSPRLKRLPTCVVVPEKRDLKQERWAREKRRLELNRLMVQMALFASGGELSTFDGPFGSEEPPNAFTIRCGEGLLDFDAVKRVADRALSSALASAPGPIPSISAVISWDAYCAAWKVQEDRERERADWLGTSSPVEHEKSKDRSATSDPLVEKIKKQGLNSCQQQLLGCLICPADIQTGFDSVHLPDATIDAIRTLVSLRLVSPESFNTGILKEYHMSGALLFGPPGTGKTHLAKAVAKDSGVRMLSIKPSDILDKYVGESQKKVDALFKLARQLKPCLIFIDEVDALFAARMSAHDSNASRWRTDMLTQFTQEMDGMLSSDVIVIGASNRPFDLDDAILRRLPCRILVDLPDENAREAILRILLKDEQLEPEVDLTDLAGLTPNFSGSDLKHLCIMAAFESAKQLANISWAEKGKSTLSPLGILTPQESDSDEGSMTNIGMVGPPNKPSSDLVDNSTQSSIEPQTRKLAKSHFTHALKQVRASTSEVQSSLVELRRWNDQFGSGGQSSRSGYGVPGLNPPGSSRTWTNGSGAGASGIGASGVHSSSSGMRTPGMNGIGTGMSGMSMSNMNTSGTNTPGTGVPGKGTNGLSFAPPIEGSYLRSLGIHI